MTVNYNPNRYRTIGPIVSYNMIRDWNSGTTDPNLNSVNVKDGLVSCQVNESIGHQGFIKLAKHIKMLSRTVSINSIEILIINQGLSTGLVYEYNEFKFSRPMYDWYEPIAFLFNGLNYSDTADGNALLTNRK